MKYASFTYCWLAVLAWPLVFGQVGASACGIGVSTLAQESLDEDRAIAEQAIAALRAMGPAGLDALWGAHANEIEAMALGLKQGHNPPRWMRLRSAIEAVAQQRDAHRSGLYWYTDLQQAQAAAVTLNRPILSLHLLGRLDEELSCANSRLFRTVLYADKNVAAYLRDHFVLHWQSVRPVPVITIDYGDGRMLRRTITGNSVHYVLDAQARPIDALPGLYSAEAFLRKLQRSARIAERTSQMPREAWREAVHQFHTQSLERLASTWERDLQRIGVQLKEMSIGPGNATRRNDTQDDLTHLDEPDAVAAGRIAMTKAVVEMPVLTSTDLLFARLERGRKATDQEVWSKLANRYFDEIQLDSGTLAMIRQKSFGLASSSALQSTRSTDESLRLERMIDQLKQSLAQDTVHNEYALHRRIHSWFIRDEVSVDVSQLNTRVYAQLFLTPNHDPWMGLAPPYAYTAIEGEGFIKPPTNGRLEGRRGF